MQFEWDPSKAQSNVRKHGVTLDEAATVFDDPYARIIDDPDHSVVEERFIILGMSMRARELVVSHCMRGLNGKVVRIISARRATKKGVLAVLEVHRCAVNTTSAAR
jgi:uncharacterized DUF497 family protein